MNKRKLFLTSCGLSDDMKKSLFEKMNKYSEDVKVLYIPTAGIETDGAREGFAICFDELLRIGIRYENIMVYNLELILSKDYMRTYSSTVKEPVMVTRLLTLDEMKMFDVVFISGGDAMVLCREMVRTGFDIVLKKAIDDGLICVGISAGSMYMAGNLEKGLHVIDNAIIPHWNETKMIALQNDVDEIRLADGQAVYIEGDSVSLI